MPTIALSLLIACSGGDLGTSSGSDPAIPTTPSPPPGTDPPPPGPDRRHDCSGIDPADPAPLGGRVALTFDDGPVLPETEDIVATLRAWGAPATFFVVGEMLADPDTWPLVEDMAADPLFELANHSWDHANLATLSISDRDEEIDDTTALLETFGVVPRYLRFPYGASHCDLVDEVRDRQLHVTGWHADTSDWCYGSIGEVGTCTPDDYARIPPEYANDMIGWTLEQVRRYDGGVILLHDIQPYTAGQLNTLMQALDAEGFTFVPLDDLDTFPRLNADNPADLPFLGEACDPIEDDCWQIEFQSWCTPTDPSDPRAGICTEACEGLCVDRPGAATTFCATVDPGAGQCVGRSDSENHGCADLPGTVPVVVDRFVGTSGVAPSSAEVCQPAIW